MIVGIIFLSAIFGGICGIASLCMGYGLIQSLIVYAIAGQAPIIIIPLAHLLVGLLHFEDRPENIIDDPI